jgi:predicted MFS family arabinose efflux permease
VSLPAVSRDESAGADATALGGGRAKLGLLAGGVLMTTSLGAYELAPASVTPLIRESLGVGPSAAGLVVSVMFGTAVVTSIPVGVVLDRTNSRHATAVAVVGLVVAGVWGWQAASTGAFVSLLASRVLGGVAYTVVWNAGIDVVGRAFAAERQATAIAVFTASGPVGFATGQAGAPVIAGAFGWPAVFPVFATSAVVGLALFWPTSRGRGRVSGTDPPSMADLRSVVTDRTVWLVGAIAFLAYSLFLFVNSWAPSYLTEELALSLALGGLLTALFPAVGVVSRVSGGLVSDRLLSGRRRPVLLLSFLVATPAVAGFTALRSVPVLVGALLVAGFSIQLGLGLVFAYVRELVDPEVAATAVAFLTSVGLAGAFLAPIFGGALIGAAGYGTAFAAAGALGVLGAVLSRFAPEP